MLSSSIEYKSIKYFIIIVSILYLINYISVIYYLSTYSSDEIIKRIFHNKNIDDIKSIDLRIYRLIKSENIDKNDIDTLRKRIDRYKLVLYLVSILSIILSLLFLVYILNYKNLSINSKIIIKRILIVFLVISIIFNFGYLIVKSGMEVLNIILYLFIIGFLNSK